MGRTFNTTGICYPDLHYMVDMRDAVDSIIHKYIKENEYFTINRARQFGKTTILNALYHELRQDYIVFFISFEELGNASFSDESEFCIAFVRLLRAALEFEALKGLSEESEKEIRQIDQMDNFSLQQLSDFVSRMCMTAKKQIILMIDEVDSASNNQIFLDFLGMLRNKYLQRRRKPTFQSVILAGVYDIKNLKKKLRSDDDHKYNSPWNIAADFTIDLSFRTEDIAGMLLDYESDHGTNMDIAAVSHLLYEYTSGYPYLVSRLCKIMDERAAGLYSDLSAAWSREGFLEAVKIILKEPNSLFDDMIKKLNENKELRIMIESILFMGGRYSFEADNPCIQIGVMFGFLKEYDNSVRIANRLFETKLYNLFLSELETNSLMYKASLLDRNHFSSDGILNMDLIMEQFCKHFSEIYSDNDQSFVEAQGRKIFLLYLKPIINGTGNYYIEAQTRNMRRTDIIVDYKGQQIVIECKLWHGEEYNRRGEQQLFEYLEEYHLEKGYLLSFNFNKRKKVGVSRIYYKSKCIVEAVV